MTNSTVLIDNIMNDHYGNFYNYAVHDEIIGKIWTEAGGLAPLRAIVKDKKAPNKARLIACEVIQQREFLSLTTPDIVGQVASIYAQALAENTTGRANSWGLLYEHDDAGPVGIRLVLLGQQTVPALVKLLDIDQQYNYKGSEEATVGNGYKFQVRDFAAYYLAKIMNLEKKYYPNREARNTEIERIRSIVKER